MLMYPGNKQSASTGAADPNTSTTAETSFQKVEPGPDVTFEQFWDPRNGLTGTFDMTNKRYLG